MNYSGSKSDTGYEFAGTGSADNKSIFSKIGDSFLKPIESTGFQCINGAGNYADKYVQLGTNRLSKNITKKEPKWMRKWVPKGLTNQLINQTGQLAHKGVTAGTNAVKNYAKSLLHGGKPTLNPPVNQTWVTYLVYSKTQQLPTHTPETLPGSASMEPEDSGKFIESERSPLLAYSDLVTINDYLKRQYYDAKKTNKYESLKVKDFSISGTLFDVNKDKSDIYSNTNNFYDYTPDNETKELIQIEYENKYKNNLPNSFKSKTNNLPVNYNRVDQKNYKDAIWNPTAGEPYPDDDLINFSFENITYYKTGNIIIPFRAIITSLSDTINSDWGSFDYVGRPDNFYIYKGFTRTVDVSFDVGINSRSELLPSWRKLNLLAGLCYPSQYDDKVAIRAPITAITIGSLYNRVYAIMNSFSINIDANTIWEIEKNFQVPLYVAVSVNFTILYDDIPQFNSKHFANYTGGNNWIQYLNKQGN